MATRRTSRASRTRVGDQHPQIHFLMYTLRSSARLFLGFILVIGIPGRGVVWVIGLVYFAQHPLTPLCPQRFCFSCRLRFFGNTFYMCLLHTNILMWQYTHRNDWHQPFHKPETRPLFWTIDQLMWDLWLDVSWFSLVDPPFHRAFCAPILSLRL